MPGGGVRAKLDMDGIPTEATARGLYFGVYGRMLDDDE